ncbi:MAG: FecR family protein [Desulfovibrionaceae bacterium]
MKGMILALLTMLLALGGSAEASEQIGNVKTLSGTAYVQRGDTQLRPALGDTLQVQDRVRTGADGSIGISFVDGTRLSLGPSSDVALRDYVFAPQENTFAFSLELLKGTAAYISGRLGKLSPDSVKIATPHVTIGIRGTSFALKVN